MLRPAARHSALCYALHARALFVDESISILQRKRLCIVDFESKDHLRAQIDQFIHEWTQQAHPFNWSTKSVAKVMAAAPALAA
jgi:hypothetical protein